MGAIPRQIKACEDHGLSPLYASELYYNPWQAPLRNDQERKAHMASLGDDERVRLRKNFHLLAIALDETGYSNLVRLSSWGYTHGWGGRPARPRVNREVLSAHKAGILFTSCCYASEIGHTFDTQGEDAAMEKVAEHIGMFGENFRLEIMMLDFVKQRAYDRFIIRAHDRFGVPLLLSNDTHYCEKEDSKYQRYMLMLQTGRTVKEIDRLQAEGADLFELQDQQLWMKSEVELNDFWSKEYSDVIDYDLFKSAKLETLKICKMARGVKLDRSDKLPQLPDAEAALKEAISRGAVRRNIPDSLVYHRQLAEEYDLICRKGYASYFMIQKQLVDEARRVCPGILGWGDGSEAFGCGRGSAVGSLSCYCLGITHVNPIKHDLLFSRFLSEARGGKTMKLRFVNIDPVLPDPDGGEA